MYMSIFVPAGQQLNSLQATDLVAEPEHEAPPFAGAGLEQVRVTVAVPPPQPLLQPPEPPTSRRKAPEGLLVANQS